ncbi:MAG: hypothetical protein IJY84_02425 [Clostridia bacterium]|nr:hypothetical protein [Clostridia bacterium]
MGKLTKRILCFLMLFVLAFSTAISCGDDENTDQATLHVYSFTSGFGTEWITSLIADFEAAHANDVIEGFPKTGIHVVPTTLKQDVSASQMASNNEVVYFLEQKDYYELLAARCLADITDAVVNPNPYDTDGSSLEDKMFADQKSYLGRAENGSTRYYAYPHYFTSFGIAYNVELFDRKGYYFAKGYNPNGTLEKMFLGEDDCDKTAGPDGQEGTADDGLPTTYSEFLKLCEYIYKIGNDNPLVWSGQHREAYLTHFVNALATDYEGYDQMRLNYTFDGDATTLGKIVSGKFVKDAKPTTIDGTNGAELARQAGKYYAMEFYQKLYSQPYISNDANEKTLYSSSYSHWNAQEDFLATYQRSNAMLLDGSWWNAEAQSQELFDLTANDASENRQNRKVGYMPLPKYDTAKVEADDGKQTMFDLMYPLLMLKNGLDTNSWEYKYAIKFIQFANSNAQLAKFTQITGATKALNYKLDKAQYDALSFYGKTYYDAYIAADKVFPYDNNLLFANNQSKFNEIVGADGSPLYKSADHKITFISAVEGGETAANYFEGIYNYFKELDIWKKAK